MKDCQIRQMPSLVTRAFFQMCIKITTFVSQPLLFMLTAGKVGFRGISSLKIGDKPNWTTPEKWNWTFMTWICVFWSFFLSSHFEYRKFGNIEYSNQANPRISRVAGRQVVPGLSRARYFQKWTFLSWVCSILIFFFREFLKFIYRKLWTKYQI